LLRSFSSQTWQQGGFRGPANCCHCALRAVPAHWRGTSVDLAGRRPGPPSVLVRPYASVCGRAAPWGGPRCPDWHERARARGRRHLVRRNRSWWRQDRLDRDAARLHGDPRPPRLDRRETRDADRRRRGRRRRRTERRRRPLAAVRLLRASQDRRRPGLRRSVAVPAGAARRSDAGCTATARACRGARRRDSGRTACSCTRRCGGFSGRGSHDRSARRGVRR
jgi:hypothetical protein